MRCGWLNGLQLPDKYNCRVLLHFLFCISVSFNKYLKDQIKFYAVLWHETCLQLIEPESRLFLKTDILGGNNEL